MAYLYQKHISTQSPKTTASTMRIFTDQLRMTTKRDNDYTDSGLWSIKNSQAIKSGHAIVKSGYWDALKGEPKTNVNDIKISVSEDNSNEKSN